MYKYTKHNSYTSEIVLKYITTKCSGNTNTLYTKQGFRTLESVLNLITTQCVIQIYKTSFLLFRNSTKYITIVFNTNILN